MTPPTTGPTTAPTPYTMPRAPRYCGSFLTGKEADKRTRFPLDSPAAPSPATARPAAKAAEFGARAHIKEPISKMANATRKTTLMGYSVKRRPKTSWKEQRVML